MIEMLYEPFRKWSANGSVYIFSDTHFNDFDCKLMDKSWISAEDQLTILNKVAHKNDTLILLGDVGLNYLTLSRMSMTLSGGEAQRIRLATQIGSKLSGILYVLDEPSIGLHQKDNEKLIKTIQK